MSDKQHCRMCGAELVKCDGCDGHGKVHFEGPMDTETGYIGYDEDCGECRGYGAYAAPSPSLGEPDIAAELYNALQALWADRGNPDNWTACNKEHRRNYKDMILKVSRAMSMYEGRIKEGK